ncbi:hypothetical protein SUDANB146_03665 [Streptomyces sp. enrichment culture]
MAVGGPQVPGLTGPRASRAAPLRGVRDARRAAAYFTSTKSAADVTAAEIELPA